MLGLEPDSTKTLFEELQIIVIDSFYSCVNNKDAMSWLGDLFRFKTNSYLASYPYGILPFGASDLVGTQLFLARKIKNKLHPMMGVMMIDSDRTETFRMDFPAFERLRDPGLEMHHKKIELELEKARREKYPLGYVGSWAIDPTVRHDPILSKICKKMSSALITQWILQFDIQVAIAFASLRFHVEKFHAYLGVIRMAGPNGEQLCDFKVSSAMDEPCCASIFYRQNLTQAAKQDVIDTSALWEKRIVIASEDSPFQKERHETKIAA